MDKCVWILNHYAKTYDMPGGTRHYDFGSELSRDKNMVIIFASGFDHSTKKYIKCKKSNNFLVEKYNNVKFVWLKTLSYKKNNYRRILSMFSYGIMVLRVCKRFPKPDVIIGSSMHPIAVSIGWWLAKKHRAKFFFEIRDLWPQTAIDMGALKRESIIAKLLFIWEKIMYRSAEKIIVLMPFAYKYIIEKGIDKNKIVWIPNGINIKIHDKNINLDLPESIKNKILNNIDKFKIFYTGAHGIANGLYTIVDSADLLRNEKKFHFYLFGEGNEKKKIINKADKLGLRNISFCEAIPKKLIPKVLSYADCLIIQMLPRGIRKYGVSQNKMLDYLASSKPIILAGNPPNNLVKEADAGLTVKPESAHSLAKGIKEMENMKETERKAMGLNGRKYVEKYYDTELLSKKLKEII